MKHKITKLFSKKTSTEKKEVQPERTADFSLSDTFQAAINAHQTGNFAQAEMFYQQILHYDPNQIDALHFLGILYHQTGNSKPAAELISKAIAVQPTLATAAMYSNLGAVYQASQQYELAGENFKKALQLEPTNVNALYNLGVVLHLMDKTEEAIENYQKVILLQPNYPEAYYNLGALFQAQNQLEKASEFYKKALALKPDYLAALLNTGIVLYLQRQFAAAIDCYYQVLAHDAQYPEVYSHLGNAFLEQGDMAKTVDCYEKALVLNPSNRVTLQNLFYIQLKQCDWSMPYLETCQKIEQSVLANKNGHTPFTLLAISSSALIQQKCAEHYAKNYPLSKTLLWQGESYTHAKIRVAYVSGDYREHPLSYLMMGVFEQHNRERFEVIAISLKPAQESVTGQRVKNAFDQFIDVSKLNDYEVALLMRNMEIDIAVDLMGFTTHSRTGIFAYRPAPIQINYLGFPATMGTKYIDYIFADPYLIPSESQEFYTEKVVYLPDCFQANDDKKIINSIKPSRTELGLPESSFIFCSFNNNYKMTPVFFDIWMRLLKAVPDSVLWLIADDTVANNLRNQAKQRGVNPQRLIFAKTMEYANHLARLQLADLFLDSLPFNAGTTASDALWAGVPIVTCSGEAFASRMAGSLLHGIGLPELITHTLEEYEALALRLASHPEELAQIKAKLAKNRDTYPLFDTKRFTRHIESAYETMRERTQRGEPAVSFSVSTIE